ncbi:MAG: non-heme iron oxygenase ferredoxin subunit [Acidimicrobiales bacterium]
MSQPVDTDHSQATVGRPERETDAVTDTQMRLCRAEEVAPGTARRFDVAGHDLAVIRIVDDFYVIGDRCSHENVSLSDGDVCAEDREIECCKHGSTFSLVTGEAQCLPATKPVPVYRVAVRDGDLMVTLPGT